MQSKLLFPSLILIAAFVFSCNQQQGPSASDIQYPDTKKVDTVDTYFGNEVPDPYRWLEDDNAKETKAWVKKQNKVTFSYLNDIPFRDQVKGTVKNLIDYEKVSAPDKHGNYYYYYKNDGLQDQSVYYRTKDLKSDEEEVFLNPNNFSEDGTISMAGTSFSSDGSLMTYLISDGGSDWRKAITLNTETKEVVGDTLTDLKFTGISWKGTEGFYYSSYERPKEGEALTAANKNQKVYFHEMGTPQSEDRVVFGDDIQRRGISAGLTEDERFLVLSPWKGTSGNELYIKDLEDPNGDFVQFVDNFENNHSILHSDGDRLLIYTNLDAQNYRIVETTIDKPNPENWKTLVPESEHVLNSASSAGGYLFLNYLEDAKSKVKQLTLDGEHVRDVDLPAIGSAGGFGGESEDTELYYTFTSFTYPSTVFRYDIESGSSELYEQPEVAFDPEQYETKQVFYESKDGTEIPMFIVHKKGVELDGNNPALLYGYGGFNISLTPSYSTRWISWLEMGGVFAMANLRGGGEYGKSWHKAGIKMQKQNVFDDFIAAGEYLKSENYTSSDKLAIMGGSNGGLLVGATMTQRPDLAQVAIPQVGVLDMLRYHKFTIGAAWASDYGRADASEEMFEYLYGYSPYHNLEKGTGYPATLITTADHDDRVVPAHSFKFAARLQEYHSGDTPVLIRIETRAGHGAGTPTSKTIKQLTDIFSFTLYNMNEEPEI
ncbi:prolyl oligopeptidase family serine peptidase [Fodinibius halophilus]|uniref:prolyl oligopeptidase n=1 Tax=Fodinibius halophilus TaxID=1736908 RepID=A0A6M1TAB0_9BACT|nr:prolyl oligopeptidase family serine peptidase [Fodinibius halophilus]NGP89393.1 S9 family peptidase [Fodinibius halophilus]